MHLENKKICCSLMALSFLFLGLFPETVHAQKKKKNPDAELPVSFSRSGNGIYAKDAKGNRIPDYSYCGYEASDSAIPFIAAKIRVPLHSGDATSRIQAAIDYVSRLPLKNGFRGAVLLDKGEYQVNGILLIRSSGVVLRGSGLGVHRTVLVASGVSRDPLVRILGTDDRVFSTEEKTASCYIPVGSFLLKVRNPASFKVGMLVRIHRPSTMAWIEKLKMVSFGGGISSLGWKPNEKDIYFERKVLSVNPDSTLQLDAPITTALDPQYGGATLSVERWNGRIFHVGIENLQMISSFDSSRPKDEDHRWMGIIMENVMDSWVRGIRFEHFAGSAVEILETGRRITVEDCASFKPVSEIGGERRNTFFTNGSQTLFQRLYAEDGGHDFAVGYLAPGPNAFVQCQAVRAHDFSGTISSWASGVLFDVVNVDGNAIRFGNRMQDAKGAGWSAANSLLWNCSSPHVDCYAPPTAQNWSFGTWAQFGGDGFWAYSNEHMNPRSFYYAQLQDRLKREVTAQAAVQPVVTDASSSPSVEEALRLTKESVRPHMQLLEWIALQDSIHFSVPEVNPIADADQVAPSSLVKKQQAAVMTLYHGWMVRGSQLLTGKIQEVPWWNGGTHDYEIKLAGPAITRYVPGRIGHGLTDDLAALTDSLRNHHFLGLEQHYALWYERRRDDHERIRRMDGDVWPPFYELPFARSGKDTAWDGLSKYDLTRYNLWYWNRLKQFADLCDEKGLVLIHEDYFQHNIIEAGAHYVDFPWRSANNINQTGFPEPPPFAGDKRIFMAEQFYDTTNAVRRALHVQYIRQCLDNFKNNNGVVQLIGEEFTGPFHFVRFWLNTIRTWEAENVSHPFIGLSTTKDVQDSVLSDPTLNPLVDLIDIKYWHYQADAKLYAPPGGQSLAPRQWARLMKPKVSSFDQVYRAVYEYKQRFPRKAVIYSCDGREAFGWAILMAGGSFPVLPAGTPDALLKAVSEMNPEGKDSVSYRLLASNGSALFYFFETPSSVKLAKSGSYKALVRWIDPATGHILKEQKSRVVNGEIYFKEKERYKAILWVSPIS